MILRACGTCNGLHPQNVRRCPSYRTPSGRRGSTRAWRTLRERILAPPPEERIPRREQDRMGYFMQGSWDEYRAHYGIGPLGGDVPRELPGEEG